MVSEINNSGSAASMSATSFTAAAAAKVNETHANATPKVVAPKSVDIKFDPAEASQNLHAAVSMLNEQMASTKQGLGFSFDESINSPVIKVSNIHTGEVVRQIPTEDVLRMAHKIDDLKGILYNKAA